MDKARNSGQAISKNAAPGTFASGVQKVTDVLPGLMADIVQSAPDNQKDKISKLLDIWERGQTFPSHMVAAFKQQLNNTQKGTAVLQFIRFGHCEYLTTLPRCSHATRKPSQERLCFECTSKSS